MKKYIISAIAAVGLTATAAVATSSQDCGYNPDGTFNTGNGQVSMYGSWQDAKACAKQGLLPAVVAERLGKYGTTRQKIEADALRAQDATVRKERADAAKAASGGA